MNKDIEKISDLFLNSICEFYEYDKKEKTFGTDTKLYHSEIHMIQYIKENENLHISGIARKLGITRGAASQTIKRLEKKNMIIKEADLNNNLKVVLKLTQKGETAYLNHKKYHEKYNALIGQILEHADNKEKDFLYSFLLSFERYLKNK